MKYFLIFCTILFEAFSLESFNRGELTLPVKTAILNDKDEVRHERYARHVEAITENVIDHLLREIKKKFSSSNKRVSHQQLSRVAQEITNKMKHLRKKQMKKKNKKHREMKDDYE